MERQKIVLDNIKTKVHPLNEMLVDAVTKSLSKNDANKIVFSSKERNPNEIRLLSYNTQLIPLWPKGKYKSGYQYERLADLVTNYF